MSEIQSSYRSIVKATSIFGGVQVIQSLLNIVKSKFVAIFLGTVGIGISGLLTSTVSIFTALGELGLNFTATREIAQASYEGDNDKVSKIYAIYSRWLYISAFVGILAVVIFSSAISKYSFGNTKYQLQFILLSISLFFNILAGRNTILLQGVRHVREIALSTVFGSLAGLLISVPIYYFEGQKGIVPSIILTSISVFLITNHYVLKINLRKVSLTIKETLAGGSEMVRFGLLMTFGTIVGNGVVFYLNAFISRHGSLSDVGLYNAGMNINTQYIGLVFTAMSIDYFPKLAGVNSDQTKSNQLVNHQSEIILLIILPLLVSLILATPLVIRILFTIEFIKITNFIRIIAIGTVYQAAGYAIGFLSLAKGDKKTFFIVNAMLGNLLGIILFSFGYYVGGLDGLAIAIMSHQIIFFGIYNIVTYKLYGYVISRKFIYYLVVTSFMTLAEYFCVWRYPNTIGYCIGVVILTLSITYSLIELNKLINLRSAYFKIVGKLGFRRV